MWLVFSRWGTRLSFEGVRFHRCASFSRRSRGHESRSGAFRHAGRAIAGSYVISLLFYVVAAATVWMAGQAVGAPLPMSFLVSIMPLVLFLGLIPISVNGLGLLETGYVVFLGLGGASNEAALSIALLLRMRILLTAVIGGVSFLVYKPDAGQRGQVSF